MKKLVLSVLIGNMTIAAFADIIVKKDGKSMTVYNVDVGSKYVSYQESEADNAPSHRLPIDECFAVKIGDGEMQMLGAQSAGQNDSEQKSDKSNTPRFVETKPAGDNQDLIDGYNSISIYRNDKQPNKDKTKYADIGLAILGITPQSILSDENVTISFELNDKSQNLHNGEVYDIKTFYYKPNYKIRILNKTKENLYFDLTNSYRIASDGIATPIYSNKIVSSTNGKSNGGALNLGGVANAVGLGGVVGSLASGITLGSGNSSSVTVTESQDAILIIPPGAVVCVPQTICQSENGKKVVKNHEEFEPGFTKKSKKELPLILWEYTDFGDRELNKAIYRVLTYSKYPDFREYSSLKFGIYVRGIYGYFSSYDWMNCSNTDRGLWYKIWQSTYK